MAIATLIERIIGKQQDRQAADFRDMVVQIADGKEPDADLVAQVLRDTQKSLEDLQQAVALLQRRRQWKQCYDGLPKLAAERKETERQIAVADKAFEAAQEEFDQVIAPLMFRMQQIREANNECEKAKQGLWDTCADPNILDKLADIRTQLSQVHEEAHDLRRRIDDLHNRAASDRAEAERQKLIVGGDPQVKAYLDRAREYDRKTAECKVMLTKADKIVSDLEQEETEIRKKMLVP